jgi:hypothetical protein
LGRGGERGAGFFGGVVLNVFPNMFPIELHFAPYALLNVVFL